MEQKMEKAQIAAMLEARRDSEPLSGRALEAAVRNIHRNRKDELNMEHGSDKTGRCIAPRPVGENADGHRHYGCGVAATSLEELFDGYRGGCSPSEMDWGEDVGAEVLE